MNPGAGHVPKRNFDSQAVRIYLQTHEIGVHHRGEQLKCSAARSHQLSPLPGTQRHLPHPNPRPCIHGAGDQSNRDIFAALVEKTR